VDVERDVTVLVETFERPDCLRRLVAFIRSPIVVVDESARRTTTSGSGC